MNGANILGAAANTTATYTGVISGTGGLTVGDHANPGTVVLSNLTNSYTGGTTVSGVTLRVANDASLGDPSGGLTLDGGELVATRGGFFTSRPVALTANGGTLAAAAGGLAELQGNITGSGSLAVGDIVNTGTVDLSGTNTYLGNTTIVSGTTLKALSTGALSSTSAFIVTGILDLNGFSNQIGSLAGTGMVTNGDTFGVVLTVGGDNTSTTFSGVLKDGTDPLGLSKIGARRLTLTGDNTFIGGTTISLGGALQIGNGPTSGSIVGDVTDKGTLAFNRTNAVTFSGNISGAGALNQSGTGTLILTGANTYTGGTTINGGTLQIGSGNDTGSIMGDVIDNAALVINRSGTFTIAGVLGGAGTLSQIGPGTLILTGTSTYTGGTAVTAGTLQVDGALGNTAVNVQSGTTLAGKGAIGGSVTIQDGGHLAAGPGAQTLSVGNLFLNPGSILDYQLNTPVIGSGMNTLVNVAGDLTLAGVLNVTTGGGFGSGAYRLINYTGALTDLTLDLGTLRRASRRRTRR